MKDLQFTSGFGDVVMKAIGSSAKNLHFFGSYLSRS